MIKKLSSLSKLDKIIIYCIFYAIPLGLLIYFLLSGINGSSTSQIIRERDSLENVTGIVDSVFNDEQNHNIRTALLTNKKTFQIFKNREFEIEKGDSLYKKEGTFYLEIYKKSGKKLVLDYKTTFVSE